MFGPDVDRAKKVARKTVRQLSVANEHSPFEAGAEGRLEVDSIQFKDVWFKYPTKKDQWVFTGLSFTIKRGDKVAFVAESGAGKSTILGLLLRFYQPNEGVITINGKDIAEYSLK